MQVEEFLQDDLVSYRAIRSNKNRFANWYGPGDEAAGRRINGKGIEFDFEPKFTLETKDPVFTIGSCFARNVETALLAAGFSVPAAENCAVDPDLLARAPSFDMLGNGYLNKYNTHSILSHLEIALEEPDGFPELVELRDGKYYSVLTHNIRPMELAEAKAFALHVRSVIRRIKDCKTVILTLGLNEVFFDRKERIFLNGAPMPQVLVREPDRYEFFCATVSTTVRVLEAIHKLLRNNRVDTQIVVTVSPVPMGRTMTRSDVIVANTLSKSVLRAAAWQFASDKSSVEYFPSYEMAMLSDPQRVWAKDRAHVQPEFVNHIIGNFSRLFVAS